MKNAKFAALGDYARVYLARHKVNGRADLYQTAAEVTTPEDKVMESQCRCYNTNTKLLTQHVRQSIISFADEGNSDHEGTHHEGNSADICSVAGKRDWV